MQAAHPLQQQARLFAELESKKYWRECYLKCFCLIYPTLLLQLTDIENINTIGSISTLPSLFYFLPIGTILLYGINLNNTANIQHQLGNAAPLQKQTDFIQRGDPPLISYMESAVLISMAIEYREADLGLVESCTPIILKTILLGITTYLLPNNNFEPDNQEITTEPHSAAIIGIKAITALYVAALTSRQMYLDDQHPLVWISRSNRISGVFLALCAFAVADTYLKTSRAQVQYTNAANNLIAPPVQPLPAPQPPAQQPPAPQPPAPQPPAPQPPAPQPAQVAALAQQHVDQRMATEPTQPNIGGSSGGPSIRI
ncbi:MAG: hypothetical protein P1U63_04565 [Coxiellaceae bacterium]|nr:hypothetical protein [Coxiellaceae bacterium]